MDSAGPTFTVGGAEPTFYGGVSGFYFFNDCGVSSFPTLSPVAEGTASF